MHARAREATAKEWNEMNNMLPCARAADVRACVPDRGLLAPRVRVSSESTE
jgi:hypothetical protein